MVDSFHNEPLNRNLTRLYLDAEGELDFRNVKLKNLKMRREKMKPRSKIFGVLNFCFSVFFPELEVIL